MATQESHPARLGIARASAAVVGVVTRRAPWPCQHHRMPQKERPDEALARSIVVGETGLTLCFADLAGGVDYRSPDGHAILEVTRFTSPRLRQDYAKAGNSDHVRPLGTGYDWLVTFDGYPRYDNIEQRLFRPLQALEAHGLREWHRDEMTWWMSNVPTLTDTTAALTAENVRVARSSVRSADVSKLMIMSSSGWTYGGPDTALPLLEDFIRLDAKHAAKLAVEVDADERHLWVWTDAATEMAFRRALSNDEDRLPSSAPSMPAGVTHLWCVDDFYLRGWTWSAGYGWRVVTVDEHRQEGAYLAPFASE